MRLVLLADRKGVPVGYDLVGPKTGQERDAVLQVAAADAGSTLFADGGFWGREHHAPMQLIDIELITPPGQSAPSNRRCQGPHPARHQPGSQPQRQMGLQDHLAKRCPASSPDSPSACSRSPSASTSTPSSDDHHAPGRLRRTLTHIKPLAARLALHDGDGAKLL
jgi:hypothetical protein